MNKFEDFEDTAKLVKLDLVARVSAHENSMRRDLAELFEPAMKAKKLDMRSLAVMAGTSISQIKRLLHHELGGVLYLGTIFRVADVLGFQLEFSKRS